jgi:hypothetical protein
MVWDAETSSVITGDETGRLRRWCLKRALKTLNAVPYSPKVHTHSYC